MLYRERGPASGLGYGPSHGEEQLSLDLQEFLPANASVIQWSFVFSCGRALAQQLLNFWVISLAWTDGEPKEIKLVESPRSLHCHNPCWGLQKGCGTGAASQQSPGSIPSSMMGTRAEEIQDGNTDHKKTPETRRGTTCLKYNSLINFPPGMTELYFSLSPRHSQPTPLMKLLSQNMKRK